MIHQVPPDLIERGVESEGVDAELLLWAGTGVELLTAGTGVEDW